MNMTPTLSTAAASTSVGLASVVVFVWFLSFFHVSVPADVATALGTIATNGVHWFMTKPNCFKLPVKTEG
jgi:hypothetical protein